MAYSGANSSSSLVVAETLNIFSYHKSDITYSITVVDDDYGRSNKLKTPLFISLHAKN